MAEVSPLVARWQHRLDQDFPKGAICSWAGQGDLSYRVARPEVTGTEGMDPVVRLAAADADRVLGPDRVLSYAETEPGLFRVAYGDGTMVWSSRVPDGLARQLAPLRQQSLQLAPDGGPAILGIE